MMAGVSGLEVEAKFCVTDLAAVRRRLLEAGAKLRRPRIYERNIRLERGEEELLEQAQLLRLRQDDRAVLTFKGRPPPGTQSVVKVHEELEVIVSDFATMQAILERLGFRPAQVYEKYRESFRLGELEIVLDELPYGDFVELEGDEAAIQAAATRLGLDWSRRLNTNYLALMGMLVQQHKLPFSDLTFSNFQTTDVRIHDMLKGLGPLD